MKRLIPIALIIIGILLIIYPNAKDFYFSYQQEKLIVDWQESMLNIETQQLNTSEPDSLNNQVKTKEEATSETVATQQIKIEQEKEKQERERLEREKQEKEKAEKRKAAYIKSKMEGMLNIEKIDLKVPILTEATTKNLSVSVSSIINTGKAGEVGNYCIAGHKSKDYGKNFNRLDEVEVGDSIKVNDGTNEYQYSVYDKFMVKPEEIWVLKGNKTQKEITLITCDKVYNSTQRLIIKGRMIE